MNRKERAVKGSVVGLVSQFSIFLVSFCVKTIFVKCVVVDIMGIEGVLRNMIATLSLADLGIETAMTYRLYNPVAKNDVKTVNKLLSLYKYLYRIIAGCILLIGIVFSLFIPHIITDVAIEMRVIYIAYYIQLLTTISSYLMAYRRCLITAFQENYLLVMLNGITTVISGLLKVAVLLIFKSYYLYLITYFIQAIVENIIIGKYTKFKYEEYCKKADWDKEMFALIKNDTKHLFAGRIVGYVYGSTDNLIISALISTIQVGLLSNYKYVVSSLQMFMNGMTSSIGSLIAGSLNADDNREKHEQLLNKYSFVRFVLAAILIIPFVILLQPFIHIWLGQEYLMKDIVVYLMASDLYISIVYGALGTFTSGCGYFKEEKKVAIIGTMVNICFSLFGAIYIGLEGVLLGTVLSQISMWIGKARIIFGKHFSGNKKYIIRYISAEVIYFLFVLGFIVLGLFLDRLFSPQNILQLFIWGICIELAVVSVGIIVFRKTAEMKYLKELIQTAGRR